MVKRMNKRILITASLLITLFFLLSSPNTYAQQQNYFTVVAEKSRDVIFETAMEVSVGDYYLNEQNKKYRIIKVDGKKCIAKFEGTVKLIEDDDNLFALSQGLLAQKGNKLIALYNTHSDESYKPTSGTHSEPGKGDVFNVAAMLAQALEKKGIEVIHNQSKHDPHDGGAYERSRRTATRLARKRPDAIFDIHRDGVPNSKEYTADINGKKFGQVRMVVGRQNPQMKVNDKFAKEIKAVTDKYYPGLVKGIFYAKGKYNQDLSPRSLILEFATYVQPQEAASVSVNLFADSINKLLYGGESEGALGIGGTTTKQTKANESSGAFSAIGIILAIVLVIGGFLFFANKTGAGGAFSNSLGVKEDDDKGEDDN
ncbi:stage II sporulation protein P [Orenia metallireducens]|uniref:Stage II sporulation protein P n=2 Tax=Orenia metallireducens TaxID=1413210 RepID=A0A285HXJ7_9FIRM|nr:stage II sporulation protein P [Orenia metallireducens]SNY39526.1 stage II sporulation protein P [Orenia metallireducens]